MDVRRLDLLRELADRGSVTAVAEATGRTPSAVSQQLKVLEREAGMPLTERSGRGFVLTSAGHALARSADRGRHRARARLRPVGRVPQPPERRGDAAHLPHRRRHAPARCAHRPRPGRGPRRAVHRPRPRARRVPRPHRRLRHRARAHDARRAAVGRSRPHRDPAPHRAARHRPARPATASPAART